VGISKDWYTSGAHKRSSLVIYSLLVSALAVVACGCVSTEPIGDSHPGTPCVRPKTVVQFRNADMDLEVGVPNVGGAHLKTEDRSKQIELVSKAARDDEMRDYLVCLAQHRDGASPEYVSWLQQYLGFMATQPSSDACDMWAQKHPAPPKASTRSHSEMWRVREEYEAMMRTGGLLAGRQDMLIAEMYHHSKGLLDGIAMEPPVFPGPVQNDRMQRIATDISSLVHEDLAKWAQERAKIESRIDQYFGSTVAALAKTCPNPRDTDPMFAFSRLLASITPEVLSRDQAGRRAWTVRATEALERAMQAYGSGVEGDLAMWRDSVLNAMDEAMTKRKTGSQ